MLYGPDARTKSSAKASSCVRACLFGWGHHHHQRTCLHAYAICPIDATSFNCLCTLIFELRASLYTGGKSRPGLIGFASSQFDPLPRSSSTLVCTIFRYKPYPLYVVKSLLIENDMWKCDGCCRHLIKPIVTAYSRVWVCVPNSPGPRLSIWKLY